MQPIDMEIFKQILELDEEDDETREFSREMVETYFGQADETFQGMKKAM